MKAKAVLTGLYPLLWPPFGGLVIAFFFTSTFLSKFSPINVGGFEALFLGPMVVGFLIGILLGEYEIPTLQYVSILTSIIAITIIGLAIYAPVISGEASSLAEVPQTVDERQSMVITTVFLIPLTMIGSVLGKAFREVALPSEEEVELRKVILKETREWHRDLSKRKREEE